MSNTQIQNLSVSVLQPNPLQPRGIIQPESIMDLVDSIEEHGILEPLVVAHTPAGYQIIAGERRWRASKIAGLDEVPCIVKETSPRTMLEMAIVENVQREDLNPIDKAKAFQRLAQEFNLTWADVARRVSKSLSYISNTVKLLDLPDAITDGLLSGMITEGHARAIQGIPDKYKMIEAYKQILVESASVRRAEEIARAMKERLALNQEIEKKDKPPKKTQTVSEEIVKFQNQMQKSLGEKSKVKLVRTALQTKVVIVFKGNPEKTQQDLEQFVHNLQK